MTATRQPQTTRTGVALDLAYGTRDATTCGICGKHLPAAETPVFELETADGQVICAVDADRAHRPLRIAVLLLQTIVEAHGHGDKQGAADAVNAIGSGVQMLEAEAPRVAYRRPVRQQPVRPNRRGRRR